MKLQTKKSLAVTTAALALVLPLTACGSDDEGTSGGLSTAAEAPEASAANSSTEASAEKSEKSEKPEKSEKAEKTSKTSEKEKKKEDKQKSNQAQGDEEQPPTLANPFENGMPENTNEPLANGEAGSEDDRREMEDTARAVLNPGSFADWTPTILENSCKAVTEPMLEELERQGMSLEQVQEASRLAEEQGQGIELPETEVSLDDVRIDGDRASASLTARSEHGEETSTMIFQKEDGRWKLCN
ncbi:MULTISPECIES: hypothetical protein [unclassified Corynebacterium]|uniref:hypothetical protein n=1 Tax=unclassified Corynebacterium TaxID=2624378 RepID=UPI001EF40A04|nr:MULTISPECIES: hypothetical protein [unclassified Corynebacterium]MCG7290308.1 hypothetical protein [Corynebacterium sp. ACRPZ]MCG7294360.1 hypothetical protein [Corynebacterium sp. ACRPY]